ncbi:MAG: citrate/2-methylcitrate synthase [Ilumatobacteraceae bacterium]
MRAVNAALVLLADHELATSTGSQPVSPRRPERPFLRRRRSRSCDGPLHVGASRHVIELFRSAELVGPVEAIEQRLAAAEHIPGFGHSIYRKDPRFEPLMDLADRCGAPRRSLRLATAVLEAARARLTVEPNVDFALATLTDATGMDADAAQCIFLVARMAGWIAHSLEEYREPPLRFRVRGLALE